MFCHAHIDPTCFKDGQISFFSLCERISNQSAWIVHHFHFTNDKMGVEVSDFLHHIGKGYMSNMPYFTTFRFNFYIQVNLKPRFYFYNSTCMIIFVKKNKNIRMQNVTCEMFKALFTRRTFKYFFK